MKRRILFLMSDTGGGHRAAAEAIRDALYIRYGQQNMDVTLIDVFRSSGFPFNYAPEFYPWIVKRSKSSWAMSYNLSNTQRRAKVMSRSLFLSTARHLRQMVKKNPADVVVCVHSIIGRSTMDAYITLKERPPYVTVVTDLVSTHMLWYDKRAERCLVPTQAAFERGLKSGLTADQMRVTGMPVHPRFAQGLPEKIETRKELGWDLDLPTVLVVSGGEGMGSIYETARTINSKKLDCQLVIIAGRNSQLKKRLEADDWNQPTLIYPFVNTMPQFMAAADMIVTKAGPGTICEACIAGLPMILSDAIPGQETGNVEYVLENNAGVFAPTSAEVGKVVASWLAEGPEGLKRRSENARRLGRPNAIWDIADEIWQYAQHPPIPTNRPGDLDIILKPIEYIRTQIEENM